MEDKLCNILVAIIVFYSSLFLLLSEVLLIIANVLVRVFMASG
jgi:hypothetical protein